MLLNRIVFYFATKGFVSWLALCLFLLCGSATPVLAQQTEGLLLWSQTGNTFEKYTVDPLTPGDEVVREGRRLRFDIDPATGKLYTVSRFGELEIFSAEGNRLLQTRLAKTGHPARGDTRERRVYAKQIGVTFNGERLWILSGNRLYGYGASLELDSLNKLQQSPRMLAVNHQNHSVWVASRKTLYHFDRDGVQIGRYNVGRGNRIKQISVDHVADAVWLRVKTGQGRYQIRKIDSAGTSLFESGLLDNIRSILASLNGDVWMALRTGLIKLKRNGQRTNENSAITFDHDDVYLVEDSLTRHIWAASQDQLRQFDWAGNLTAELALDNPTDGLKGYSPGFSLENSIAFLSPIEGDTVGVSPSVQFVLTGPVPTDTTIETRLTIDASVVVASCTVDDRVYTCTLSEQLTGDSASLQITATLSSGEEISSDAISLWLDGDGDGVANVNDVFPDDPTESSDLDDDGIGDNTDPDRDGDDVDNAMDEYPDDPTQSSDLPVLTLFNPAAQTVLSDTITVSGTAADSGTGVVSVIANNNRFDNIEFSAQLQPNGSFTGEVPLRPGVNLVNVVAIDGIGNQSAQTVTVTRINIPVVTISSPQDQLTIESDNVSVAGEVFSYETADQLRVEMNGFQQFVTETDTEHQFTFVFANLPLTPGENILTARVEGAGGSTTDSISLVYDTASVNDQKGPVISLHRPRNGVTLDAPVVNVAGTISDDSGIRNLSINGETVDLVGRDDTSQSFNYQLDATGIVGELSITLIARDIFNNVSEESVQVVFDNLPPSIRLLSPTLASAPEFNLVNQNPVRLVGEVTDNNLASVSINGQTIALEPTGEEGVYRFELEVSIPTGDSAIRLDAWDTAGNIATETFSMRYLATVSASIVKPAEDSQATVERVPGQLPVVVELSGDLEAAARIEVNLVDGEAVALAVNGSLAAGEVPVVAAGDDQLLTARVLDLAGVVLSSTTSLINIVDQSTLDLELLGITPGNAVNDAEPNTFIKFDFNAAIDIALLEVEILETAYGETFDIGQSKVAELGGDNLAKLKPVARDREPVAGGLVLLPNLRSAAFYPDDDLTYGGTVFVTVNYAGNEVGRIQFSVRERPTFIQGIVSNQLLEPVEGILVQIPALSLSTTTDRNGSFAFGFGLTAEENIPAGRYEVVVNPDFKDDRYGSASRLTVANQGQLNRAGMFKIALLNTREPFRRIQSGASNVRLAAGELLLDLSNAQLQFNNLRDNGDIHVQFQSLSELTLSGLPAASPHWVFSVVPQGVKVSGTMDITFEAPALYGSKSYLPEDGSPVVLLGLNSASGRLMPAGVGRVRGNQIVGSAELAVLDYIAYALVEPLFYDALNAYEAGTLSLIELISEFETQRPR